MKRGRVVGTISNSRIGSPSARRLRSKISEKPLFGMNGKGWAGSIACGVRTGKICSLEMAVEPGFGLRVERLVADHRDAGLGERVAKLDPDILLALGQPVGLLDDRGELLGRSEAVGRPLLDA